MLLAPLRVDLLISSSRDLSGPSVGIPRGLWSPASQHGETWDIILNTPLTTLPACQPPPCHLSSYTKQLLALLQLLISRAHLLYRTVLCLLSTLCLLCLLFDEGHRRFCAHGSFEHSQVGRSACWPRSRGQRDVVSEQHELTAYSGLRSAHWWHRAVLDMLARLGYMKYSLIHLSCVPSALLSC